MIRIALCCALQVVAVASSAAAQRTPAPGDTVRLTVTQPSRTVSGVVVRWSTTDVELQDGAATTLQVPASSIIGLRIKSGRRSASGRGALAGLGVGGMVGIIAGVAAMSDDSGFLDFGPEAVAGGFVVMGGLGALVGASVGLLFTREAWVPGQLPRVADQVGAERPRPPSLVVAPGVRGTWRFGLRIR